MLLCLLRINSSFKKYSIRTTELFRLLGREGSIACCSGTRESLCVSIVNVALFIEDESKLQEIFKLNYRIVWLIGA